MRRRQYAWLRVMGGMILASLSTVGATTLEPVSPKPLVHPSGSRAGYVPAYGLQCAHLRQNTFGTDTARWNTGRI